MAKTEAILKFPCLFQGCEKKFRRRDKLEIHLKYHMGERPFVCLAPGCEKAYASAQHLRRHSNISHGSPEQKEANKQKCPQCDKVVKADYILRQHIIKCHRTEHECLDCGAAFRKKSQLITHVNELHGPTKEIRCPHEGCNKIFTNRSRLKRHMKVHKGYPCDVAGCEEVLSTWSSFRKHKAFVHGAFKCEQCGRVFRAMCLLKSHIKTHLKTVEFTCAVDSCGRRYQYKRNLVQHQKIVHMGGSWEYRTARKTERQRQRRKMKASKLLREEISKRRTKTAVASFLHLDDTGTELKLNKGATKKAQERFKKEIAEKKEQKIYSLQQHIEMKESESLSAQDFFLGSRNNRVEVQTCLREIGISEFDKDKSFKSTNAFNENDIVLEVDEKLIHKGYTEAKKCADMADIEGGKKSSSLLSKNIDSEINEKSQNMTLHFDNSMHEEHKTVDTGLDKVKFKTQISIEKVDESPFPVILNKNYSKTVGNICLQCNNSINDISNNSSIDTDIVIRLKEKKYEATQKSRGMEKKLQFSCFSNHLLNNNQPNNCKTSENINFKSEKLKTVTKEVEKIITKDKDTVTHKDKDVGDETKSGFSHLINCGEIKKTTEYTSLKHMGSITEENNTNDIDTILGTDKNTATQRSAKKEDKLKISCFSNLPFNNNTCITSETAKDNNLSSDNSVNAEQKTQLKNKLKKEKEKNKAISLQHWKNIMEERRFCAFASCDDQSSEETLKQNLKLDKNVNISNVDYDMKKEACFLKPKENTIEYCMKTRLNMFTAKINKQKNNRKKNTKTKKVTKK